METIPSGHIQIKRDSPVWDFKSPLDFRVFLTCLRCATHKNFINSKGIPLQRGQLWVESERRLAFVSRVKRSSLQRVLERVQNKYICVQKCVQGGIIITISDYDSYQPPADALRPPLRPKSEDLRPKLAQNGPPNIKQEEEIIKKLNIDNLIKDTAKAFENVIHDDEIKPLQMLYPFEKREALKLHLMNRSFVESEIGKIFERVYPQQYTGKAVFNGKGK